MARIHERLYEIRREGYTARVWVAVPERGLWTAELDMDALQAISNVMYTTEQSGPGPAPSVN